MNLSALLTGEEMPATGVEVHRTRVWPFLILAAAWLAMGLIAWRASARGDLQILRKPRILIGFPVTGVVAAALLAPALRRRRRGWFGWALSDTQFGYVSAAGDVVGPVALGDVRAMRLVSRMRAGSHVEIDRCHTGETLALIDLGDFDHIWSRPSSSAALFEALATRLRATGSTATISNLTGP